MSDSFGRYSLGQCTTGGCPPNLLTSASGNLASRFTQQASQRSPKTSQRSPIRAKSNKLSASQFQEALRHIRSFPAGESQAISGLPGAFSWSAPAAAFVGELPQETAFGFWMPQPLPTRTWHCVASSRLGQKLAANRTLLEALERTADSLRSKPVVVLYARSFALAAHLRALSQRAEIPLLELLPLPSLPTRTWLHRQVDAARSARYWRLFYFSMHRSEFAVAAQTETALASLPSWLRGQGSSSEMGSSSRKSPADWLAIHLAPVVHVLSLRRGGNIEAALRSRLNQTSDEKWSVRLLDDPELTSPQLARELHREGAVRWAIEVPIATRNGLTSNYGLTVPPAASSPIKLPSELAPEKFLFHWTRRPPLNRRTESDSHYLKLLEKIAKKRQHCGGQETRLATLEEPLASPLRTLLEIVTTGRITASGRWTSTGHPVVSLTSRPLQQWKELRTFRPHLGRWDFEPFGIGLDRGRVSELGGRPVIYGDERLRRQLPPNDLAWFQRAGTRSDARGIDWTSEEEWRVLGDIDLRLFGPDEAFVFAPSREAAEAVASLSRWPVVVIGE